MTRLILALTPAQAQTLQPIMDRAMKPLSPDLVLAQIRHLDWSEGGHLILDISVIPRGTGKSMKEAFLKAEAKRRQTLKAA